MTNPGNTLVIANDNTKIPVHVINHRARPQNLKLNHKYNCYSLVA